MYLPLPDDALGEGAARFSQPLALGTGIVSAFGSRWESSPWLPLLPAALAERGAATLSIGEGLLWGGSRVLDRSVGGAQGREVRFARYDPLGSPRRLSMEVGGRARFDWDGEAGKIGFRCEPGARSVLPYWLLDHAIPFFLVSSRRFSLLHAGCAAVGGRAIAWIGPSGAGKTTLLGHALGLGHSLVADDKLPILRREGRWLVLPSHPYHRVERVSETLGRRVRRFAAEPVPLGLLCLLEPVAAGEEPRVRTLPQREAFLRLAAQRSYPILWREEEEFRLFSKLVREVPVVVCRVPRDRAKLPEVFARLVEASAPREGACAEAR